MEASTITELTPEEMAQIDGGIAPLLVFGVLFLIGVAIGARGAANECGN
jgi:lactobin A/cerein 7B family class IIb bacteriocin